VSDDTWVDEIVNDSWQGDIARINRNLIRGMIAALVVIAIGIVLAVIFLLGWLDRSSDSDRITELEDSQERLFTGYDQLFEQVQELGEEPVVPPPSDVIDEPADRPEIQEQEQQDSERQDPEIQDPEVQDPEAADAEVQDPEVNDLDPFDDLDLFNDPDPDDPDPDDPEIQDPEIQDPGTTIAAIDIVAVGSNDCLIRVTFANGTSIDSDPFDCPGGNNK
jgi:cytoskeletal protein RodZ